MNACFYLLKSLKHMATRFRAREDPSPHFVYRKALVKLLFENQLAKSGKTWSHFLFWGWFQPQPPKAKRGIQKGTKPGMKNWGETCTLGTSTEAQS